MQFNGDSFHKRVSRQSVCCSLWETVFTNVSVVNLRVTGGNLHERVNAV